jgi:ABC-type transporter Mla MlaB component
MDTTTDMRTVVLSGPRTVRYAEETRTLLLEALQGSSPVTLDCSAVAEADLSFVQLLFAARRSAQLSGNVVTLAHSASGVLQQALSRAGFELAPDPLTGNQSQWLKKEGEDA